jgi:Cu/Ag efflux pump CusA
MRMTHAKVDESELARLPEHLSYEEAAALPCAGVTAWWSLFGPATLMPGETILIQGTGRIQIEIDTFGRTPMDAVIEAAQRRARPILLTTATTVLGLVPLYLRGGEMWEPMAVAIMAGLLFATVLTLLAVPVLYATLFRTKTAKQGEAQGEPT